MWNIFTSCARHLLAWKMSMDSVNRTDLFIDYWLSLCFAKNRNAVENTLENVSARHWITGNWVWNISSFFHWQRYYKIAFNQVWRSRERVPARFQQKCLKYSWWKSVTVCEKQWKFNFSFQLFFLPRALFSSLPFLSQFFIIHGAGVIWVTDVVNEFHTFSWVIRNRSPVDFSWRTAATEEIILIKHLVHTPVISRKGRLLEWLNSSCVVHHIENNFTKLQKPLF